MRRAGVALCAALAGAVAVGTLPLPGCPAGPLAVLAQSKDDVDEVAERERLRRVEEQAREKREQAEVLKRKESRELNALRDIEKKQRGTRSQISRLNRREKNLSRQLTGVQHDLVEAEMSLEDRRARLATRLRAWYKMGRFREIEYLLSAQSFTEFSVRMAYLSRLALSDRALLADILREKDRITGTRDKLDRTIDQVQRNARTKKQEQVRLAELSQEKKSLVAVIQNEREAYEAAAEELERTARRIKTLLDSLERQRLGKDSDALPEYEGDFSGGKGRLPWPVEGRVVGRFGNETHPKWNTVTFNSGIDIAAPLGTDVQAVAPGRVDFASTDYGSYGQMVILNHGEGYYTLYAHCSAILVARGQEVNAGSVIARVGDTGSLKGSILHFEIRKGRSAVDPSQWLR